MTVKQVLLSVSTTVFLMGSAHADPELPTNTLKCEQFHKEKDGTWVADQDFTFDLGEDKNISLPKTAIPHFLYYAGGMDLADALDIKCGKR